MAAPLESKIEQLFKDQAKKYNCLAMKMVSPAVRGVPDQIVMGHASDKTHRVIFVEMKRPGSRPRPDQVRMINKMRGNGASVTIIDNEKGVLQFYDLMFGKNSTGSTPLPESFYENENIGKNKARKLFIPEKKD